MEIGYVGRVNSLIRKDRVPISLPQTTEAGYLGRAQSGDGDLQEQPQGAHQQSTPHSKKQS